MNCGSCAWYEYVFDVGKCLNPARYTPEEWRNGDVVTMSPDDSCEDWEEE